MEFISEFIIFLLQCVFWYFVFNLALLPWKRRLEKQNDEMEAVIEKVKKAVHIVSVEKHGDCYYWFDADDDSFLAQGVTTEETIAHLKSRFPKHIFFVQSKDTSYKISGPDWNFVPIDLNKIKENLTT